MPRISILERFYFSEAGAEEFNSNYFQSTYYKQYEWWFKAERGKVTREIRKFGNKARK